MIGLFKSRWGKWSWPYSAYSGVFQYRVHKSGRVVVRRVCLGIDWNLKNEVAKEVGE